MHILGNVFSNSISPKHVCTEGCTRRKTSLTRMFCVRELQQKKGGRMVPVLWALNSLDVPLLEACLRYSPTCHEFKGPFENDVR